MRHPYIRTTPQEVRGINNASIIFSSLTMNLVIADALMNHVRVVGFFLFQVGARFIACVILSQTCFRYSCLHNPKSVMRDSPQTNALSLRSHIRVQQLPCRTRYQTKLPYVIQLCSSVGLL